MNRTWPLVLLLVLSCGSGSDTKPGSGQRSADGIPIGGTVVLAELADVDNFNPVVAKEALSMQVMDMIYPKLAEARFNLQSGMLEYEPYHARSWTFVNEGKSIRFILRNDVRWSDGKPITSRDYKFTYVLYADPAVGSVRQAHLRDLLKKTVEGNDVVDIDRSVETPNDTTLIIHFSKKYPDMLYNITNLVPLPAHVYEGVSPGEFISHPGNTKPLSAGPFKLERWTPKQEVVLVRNPDCKLTHPAYLDRLIIRIIPEYSTRLTELKTGNVDVMTKINTEDLDDLRKQPDLRLEKQAGRGYDYVGWMNIDRELFEKTSGKKVSPHPLFGSRKVRRALSMAINTQEIIDGFLGEFGSRIVTPVSPLFTWAVNESLKPIEYDPKGALNLLKEEGWEDHDGNGILDKNDKPFQFTLRTNTGNSRRAYTAVQIQNDCKKIGIKVDLEYVETTTFISGVVKKQYDVIVLGWNIPLSPTDIRSNWSSDLNKAPYNLIGFQNKRVDEIIEAVSNISEYQEAGPLLKEFQAVLYEEQPYTFLYWFDAAVGINNRIQGTNVTILGEYDRIREWYIPEDRRKYKTAAPTVGAN